jgi:hypothetical protein
LISINVFSDIYPTFININTWDCAIFLLTEFIISLILGYTRQRDDKFKNGDRYNMETFDFNKNFQNAAGILRGDIDRNNPFMNELYDPLLEKMERMDKE